MMSKCAQLLLKFCTVLSLVSCIANPRVSGISASPGTDSVLVKSQTDIATGTPKSSLGTMDGGGGSVVVCRADMKIKSIQLLDLYEAKNLRSMILREPKKDLETEWLAFAKRFSASVKGNDSDKIDYSEIQNLFDLEKLIGTPTYRINELATPKGETLRSLLQFKDDFTIKQRFSDTLLRRIDDSHETFTPPPNCTIEQIINYQPDDTILINKEFWQKLSDFDKTALIAHEYIYREYRKLGAKNSVQARKVVGLLFSVPASDDKDEVDYSFGINCSSKSVEPTINLTIIPGDRGKDPSTIRFDTYSDQILVEVAQGEFESLMLPQNLYKDTNSLKACVQHSNSEAVKIEDTTDSSLEIKTSYFHDTFQVSYSIMCSVGPKSEIIFDLQLKNKKTGVMSKFGCTTFNIFGLTEAQ